MKRSKWYIFGMLCFVSVIAELVLVFGLFHVAQEKVIDRLYLQKSQSDSIIIIAADEESITKIGQWPWPREVFAKVIDKLHSAKAIGIDINFSEPSQRGIKDDQLLADAFQHSKVKVVLPIELNEKGDVSTAPLPSFTQFSQQGFVNVPLDGDSVARQSDTTRGSYKSLASQLSDHQNQPTSFRIGYRGNEKRFLTFSVSDVVSGAIPERVFENKTVLIGATAESLHDTVETPFGTIPGVIVHANEVDTLQNGVFFKTAPSWVSFVLILLIVAGIYAAVHFIKNLTWLVGVLVISFLGIIGISAFTFEHHFVLPLLYFLITFFLALITSVAAEYILESQEKQFIRKTFQYYLMPEVVRELMDNPHKLKLGGEKRTITIFFSDIRGFTTISEKLSPDQLTHLINEYLTAMTDIIMEKRGLVDKYIGDAIMAFWGAPLENPIQAADACQAVLLMSSTLRRLNVEWEKRGIPHLGIGIGLNRGEVIVGNMGSEKRFNYTVMGDEVNFASRLEGLNKPYGTECIVSESVFNEVKDTNNFTFRELDIVKVKGKKEPKKIFELITKEIFPNILESLEHFKSGRALYMKGNWDAAIAEFKKAVAHSDDGPSKAFIERCEYLKKNLPQNWNGVYEFTTK